MTVCPRCVEFPHSRIIRASPTSCLCPYTQRLSDELKLFISFALQPSSYHSSPPPPRPPSPSPYNFRFLCYCSFNLPPTSPRSSRALHCSSLHSLSPFHFSFRSLPTPCSFASPHSLPDLSFPHLPSLPSVSRTHSIAQSYFRLAFQSKPRLPATLCNS